MEQQWRPRKCEGNKKIGARRHMRQVQAEEASGWQQAADGGGGEQKASLVLREALALLDFPSDDD